MARSIIGFVLFFVFLPVGAGVAVRADITVDEFRNGFDLPDWGRAWSGDMQFESDGIRIKNIGRLDQSVDVYRYEDIVAPLEFNSVVALRDLSLGDVDANSEITSFGRVTLRHRFDDPDRDIPRGNAISISIEESFVGGPDNVDLLQPEQWRINLTNGEFQNVAGSIWKTVPRGENAAIGLRARLVDGEVNIIGTYDSDIDDDVLPIEFGPIRYTGAIASSQDIEISFQSGGASVFVNSLLDRWSYLTGLDARSDSNLDGWLDIADVDQLIRVLRSGEYDSHADVNKDGQVNHDDLETWVTETMSTYFGDSNLDGEFNSADLVNVFAAGEYEDAIAGNSTWATGDWSGNGEFDSADLVLAFQDGGYELGPREAVRSVPEPNESGAAVLLGFVIVWLVRRRRFVAKHH